MTNISKTKPISVLPRPTWLDKAGMSKGIDHDRQHLGIVLASGQVIKARQTNSAFTGKARLRLLNNDAHTETYKEFGKDWVDLSVNAVSVPFIDTPYTSVAPVVEYQFPSNSKRLPVYRKGEDQSAFFKEWESQNAEFGLIEAEFVVILIPVADKDKLKSMKEVKNIDGLIDYYESVFSFYNALTGVSFEPERPTDLNPRNRYFMKADKHGAGGAYYGGSWTAESSSSVSGFWLTPIPSNWGSLHEIGHGYQGGFMSDRYLGTGEVWNNIYAASYQSVMLGDRKYKEGWLYNYGKQAAVEKGIVDYITAGKAVNSWDLRSKLYFLVTMIEAAGLDTFTHFNQQYRSNVNTPGYVRGDHALLDMLSESFATVGQQVDVTPFVDLVGGHITPAQKQSNLYSHAKAVYPLNQLVQGDTLTTLQKELKLGSALALVSVQQLQASGLKEDVKLQFQIDDFVQIYGQTLVLMDGARIAHKVVIQSQEMVLHGLTIGVYTLRLPTGRDKKYQPQLGYLVVKQTPASHRPMQQKVQFVRQTKSPLPSQTITLLGLGDDVFGNVLVDQLNGVIQVNVTSTTPHSYFPDQTYAEVVIKDENGKEKFRKTIPGTHATISHDKIPFSAGYELDVFHKEPGHRIQLSPAFDGVIDHKSQNNNFEVTSTGLKNKTLKNDPNQALLAEIKRVATGLRADYIMLHAECLAKVDIVLAINLFPSPQREQLLKDYADCVPADNKPATEGLGNAFTFGFNGISDHRFLTAELDLAGKTLNVSLAAGIAHHYFSDTYASLRYVDADGNEKLNLDVKGATTQKAQKWAFEISGYGGELLYIRHEEAPSRLIITNKLQNRRLGSRDTRQNYRILPTGVEHV
ncbi:hypothetical protein UREG_04003 [Uncinocarpus reesii 1704]|uniref:Peptidase M60 domain-containing protein n=1 Tax=Uncinocarpus reesii (strain UAMH 1704) TaxID=336963 RepID=C4JME5_UNCRE|nr:uncharacterized protein UREG_04003 [Uncinocarpus reesii 1704]EEP79157.1 hypothetical protein UREG_04003 [Uncinocarpus reesii 1704]